MISNSRTDPGLLIAGGTKGIGLGIALKLARPGLHVFLNYFFDDAAAATAAEAVSKRGATIHLVKEDAGTLQGAARIVERIESITSRLEAMVYCAAIPGPGLLAEQPIDEVKRTIDVGGLGLMYLVQPAMKLLGEGSSVVFLSGERVDIAVPSGGARGMAKAVGECMVRYLAVECAPRRINFNTLRVGPVDTGMFRALRKSPDVLPAVAPDGRRLSVEDIAEATAFLLSSAASMIRGQTICVDRGLSITRR